MSTLSQFAPFAGGGIKSVQTGYTAVNSLPSTGAGEDVYFRDITISSVATAKSVPSCFGAMNFDLGAPYAVYPGGGNVGGILLPRLTSSTNLRISSDLPGNANTRIAGRWYVIESN